MPQTTSNQCDRVLHNLVSLHSIMATYNCALWMENNLFHIAKNRTSHCTQAHQCRPLLYSSPERSTHCKLRKHKLIQKTSPSTLTTQLLQIWVFPGQPHYDAFALCSQVFKLTSNWLSYCFWCQGPNSRSEQLRSFLPIVGRGSKNLFI